MLKQNKTIIVLNTFDDKKLKDFKYFLSCKLFNKKASLVELIDCYIKFKNQKRNNDFEDYYKKEIGKDYSKSTFKNRISGLNILIKKFIATVNINNESHNETFTYLQYLYSSKLNKHFNACANEFQITLNEEEYSYHAYYFQYRLDNLKVIYSTFNLENKDFECEYGTKQLESLDRYYYILKLFQYVKLYSGYEFVKNKEELKSNSDEDIKKIVDKGLDKYDLIKAFLLILKIYKRSNTTKNLKYFNELHKLYFTAYHKMKVTIALPINTFLAIFIKNNLHLIKNWKNDLFKLYKHKVENKIYIDSGKLSDSFVKSMIEIGVDSKNIQWTENFLKEYRKKTSVQTMSENMFLYYNCIIAFGKGDLIFCDDNLLKIEIENIKIKLAIKRIYLKKTFLKKEWIHLDSTINAFKSFLERYKKSNSMSDFNSIRNTNFIKHFKTLFKITTIEKKKNKELAKNILKELKTTSEYFERDFLIDEFEKLV